METGIKHPLVAFREANGLSQEQAAAKVRITQSMWSRLETGTGYVRPSVAKRIADLTGVALESLLNFDDNEPAPHEGAPQTLTSVFPKDMP